MTLTPRELATILYALRELEQAMTDDESTTLDECLLSDLFDESDDLPELSPLTADEIDDLCQRLNFGDV